MNLRKLYIIIGVLLLPLLPLAAQKAEDHLRQGLAYVEDGNFSKAMQCFTRAMETAEHNGNRYEEAAAVGYIGNVYYNLYDYTRCLQYYTRGYELAVKLGDRPLRSNFLSNIVAAYCKTGDVQQARNYFGEVLKLRADTVGSLNMDYYILYDSARLAAVEGHPTRAISLHQAALKFARDNHLEGHYQLYQLCEIGQLYLSNHKPDSALAYGEQCLAPALRLGNRDFLTSVYQLLADSHAALGHQDETEHFRHLYFGLSDSLFNRKFVSAADRELVDYEHQRTADRISSLHHTILWQVVVIIVIVAVVLALTVLTRKLQRTNRRLLAAQLAVISKNRELKRQEDRFKEESPFEELKDESLKIKGGFGEIKDESEKIKEGFEEIKEKREKIKEGFGEIKEKRVKINEGFESGYGDASLISSSPFQKEGSGEVSCHASEQSSSGHQSSTQSSNGYQSSTQGSNGHQPIEQTASSHSSTDQETTLVSPAVTRELLPRIARAMDDLVLISNPDFSLQMLADYVGSNTRYVSAIINDRYGKNFKTLLNEHRISIACSRLADRENYGHMTIQSIYEEVGYTNAVSFIRAFRKFNGMTPSEYQKIAAERDTSDHDSDFAEM